jgi:hypothetical protein
MWSLICAQIKFNLEIMKIWYESGLRIIDRELENIENDIKYRDQDKN